MEEEMGQLQRISAEVEAEMQRLMREGRIPAMGMDQLHEVMRHRPADMSAADHQLLRDTFDNLMDQRI